MRRAKSTATTCPASSATSCCRNTASPRRSATCCPGRADPEHPAGMPRGMIETVLEAPGGKLRVLTTHLEYYSPLQRRAQVRRIRELHCGSLRAGRHLPARARPRAAVPAGLPARHRASTAAIQFAPDSEDYRHCWRRAEAWRPGPGRCLAVRHGDMRARRPPACTASRGRSKPECYDYFFVTEDLAPRVAEVKCSPRPRPRTTSRSCWT